MRHVTSRAARRRSDGAFVGGRRASRDERARRTHACTPDRIDVCHVHPSLEARKTGSCARSDVVGDEDDSTYLDSQAIGPGSAFTLEIAYHGSGNRNLAVGDSIFHCHFYPHFAQGMWALWRVHDVFEWGTTLDEETGGVAPGNRALPDGEIANGTPIPAVVPLPTIPMPPLPAEGLAIVNGQVVFEHGEMTAARPGVVLYGPGK